MKSALPLTRQTLALIVSLLLLTWTAIGRAEEPVVSFEREVAPILRQRCLKCHAGAAPKSGLDLSDREGLLSGGDNGPVVVAGKPDESLLFEHVRTGKMPPKSPLPPSDVEILRRWIAAGAAWTGPRLIPAGQVEPTATFWWSWRPIQQPQLPVAVTTPQTTALSSTKTPSRLVSSPHATPTNAAWARNPIDAFILAKQREHGLGPSPPADAGTLLRRVFLTLVGMLPEPGEVDAFLVDDRADAYDRVVDRLLASPRFGERWATHWLDVVRFAETDGFEMNQERPNAFHYRDYVIRAFNSDKPYARFIFEQLAGDSVGEDAATGFLVAGAYDKVKSPDIVLTLTQRHDELADIINTTGTAFLGLTLGCARCHDHKFDPISQRDYYALEAIFAGVHHGERPIGTAISADARGRADEIDRRIGGLEAQIRAISDGGRLIWRAPVHSQRNEERFGPTPARFVRFSIHATNSLEPCIDELEVYSTSTSDGRRNVGAAGAGARVTSSGDYQGDPQHRLAHINDGRYGNARSWIAAGRENAWVMLELPKTTVIDRVIWSRDREGRFADRLATRYSVDVAEEPGKWRKVSSGDDRLPLGASRDAKGLVFHVAGLDRAQVERSAALLDELRKLEGEWQELVAVPTVYAGKFETPEPTHRLFRGDPLQKKEAVEPNALSGLINVVGPLPLKLRANEGDRRIALAQWLTNPKNPLPARIIVNRLWQHHFGAGLVATPSDVGKMGQAPSHPELLDWLATELVAHGWSLKHIHRLIVTSSTYRQSSAPLSSAHAVDAQDRYLWRFAPRRLEAESIRDVILQISGSLDLKMYGPGFTVFQPNSNYVRVYIPKERWGPQEWRRMVYMHKVRMEQDAVFGSFDCPDAGQPTAKRSRSTTAIQALNLYNSEFMYEQAARFAQRVESESGPERTAQIQRAFRIAFGRAAEPQELAFAAQLAQSAGLVAVCRALINANELVFVP
jgi:hypothetical protein